MLIPRPLGALPIIAKIAISIVSWMVKDRLSAYAAAQMAAAEYELFKDFTEAQVSELALELGTKTQYPDWQWFNILMWAQQFGLIPPPPEPPPDDDDKDKTALWMWAIVAGVGVVVLLYMR